MLMHTYVRMYTHLVVVAFSSVFTTQTVAIYSFGGASEGTVPTTSARLEVIIPVVVCGVVLLVAIAMVFIIGLVVAWKKKRSQPVVSVT